MSPIPGVTVYHPRSEWEAVDQAMATSFTRQPPALVIGDVTQMVYHYTAATNLPDGDPGESLAQIPARLRNSQLDYLANRNVSPGYRQRPEFGGRLFPGYPLGYSFMIDWTGGVWELRGFDYRPAATNEHNNYTIAVLFYTDGASPATAAQWKSARAIGRECRRRAKRPDFSPVYRSHGEMWRLTGKGTPTACAGAGLEGQAPTLGQLDYDEPSEELTVRYFYTQNGGPTLWGTSDGLTAVRLEAHHVKARGDIPQPVPVLTAAEAAKFVYVNGLTSESVR